MVPFAEYSTLYLRKLDQSRFPPPWWLILIMSTKLSSWLAASDCRFTKNFLSLLSKLVGDLGRCMQTINAWLPCCLCADLPITSLLHPLPPWRKPLVPEELLSVVKKLIMKWDCGHVTWSSLQNNFARRQKKRWERVWQLGLMEEASWCLCSGVPWLLDTWRRPWRRDLYCMWLRVLHSTRRSGGGVLYHGKDPVIIQAVY